jgi:predicted nucleic acid-binding Zn ribbon protein
MYPTYDANKISSMGTPYALADSYAGYGECAKKIQSRYWSPSTQTGAPVVVQSIQPQPYMEAPYSPSPNIRDYPLVTENFEIPPSLPQVPQPIPSGQVSCGMYSCSPGVIPRLATIPVDDTIKEGYENDDRICSESSGCMARRRRSRLMIVSACVLVAIIIFMYAQKDK